MRNPRGPDPARSTAQLVGYGLMAVSVWLAWEVLRAPIAQRAPPSLAVRVAAASPEVLRRAAESELAANRPGNASALADESLGRAPFNARALRVRGLAADRAGEIEQADQLLTLAGNWSLRDDPAHAWLVEHRLRQGNYSSSFAHADTLVRRRTDIRPQVFELFASASAADPRALTAVAGLLSAEPPWRRAYWNHLAAAPEGDPLLFSLAAGLEASKARFTSAELSWLYGKWIRERRVTAVAMLRKRIGRPSQSDLLLNGDFSAPLADQISPFGWKLGLGSGLTVEVVEDDRDSRNLAMRVEYDGYGSSTVTQQVLTLTPGHYVFSAKQRTEANAGLASLSWKIVCVDDRSQLTEVRAIDQAAASDASWNAARVDFAVPEEGCQVQRLLLSPRPADRRAPVTAWFDDVQLARRADAQP